MQSEAIQNQSTPLASIIQQILQQIKIRGVKYQQQDALIEKELINKLQTCELASEKLLPLIQKLIDNNKLQSPNKYIVLMYASLLGVGNNHSFALFNFYYKLASHALKEIQEIKTKNQQIWQIFFEKLYQFGMLLLTGNRTLLLSMQSLGTRVNSQLFANNAREMKLNKLVRIYNCILCIPQTYMTLKQTLSLTLVFTRWSMSQNDAFTHSFFASFEKKTQKKLIKKLSRYPKQQFIQQHILNLIKIVMCGQEMLFSYFLQAKVAYQCSKNQNIMGRQKFALEGLKGASLLKQGKRLFNLVIKLLLQAREGPLKDITREAILVITFRFISSKFQNNEGLFNILIDNFLYEKNQIISQIAFRLIWEEVLSYLTVYKVKLLLNLFNISSWGLLVKNGIAEELVIDRLAKINLLLMALAHRYSNSNINLKCQSQKAGLIIENPRDVKSLTFVIVFQDVGKLSQPDNLGGNLLRLKLDGDIYQLKISFSETSNPLSIQYKPEQKQRQGKIQIISSKKQLLNEAKQFIRYKDGSYISLVTASLGGKEGRKLNLSVDGSYYEFEVNKKSEIKSIQVGRMKGIIQSFYALNMQISPVEFYKRWSEFQMKTNYVIERLGKDKICYKLTNRLQTPILTTVEKGWSLFKAKTQISIIQAIKSPMLLDIFLQLGGLQTMFFILQRLSRTLLQFKGKEQKIVQLLGQFFEMIKLTATLDQSYSFIIQIVKCFKYINPFMFLLIKRNKIFKQTHDSRLLLNIFEMIMYFRKEKPLSTTPNQIIKKMKQIQIKFLVQTLCNFQIWSGCSFPLQQFILSLIENFIKNENIVGQLIQIDLYKQLLGTLVLFATSQTHLQNSLQLQTKVMEVCEYLYRQIKTDLSIQQIKQIQLGKDKQLFDNFIERDLFMSFSLLKALGSKGFYRKLSESQKSAFIIILKHISKTFIQTSFFKIIAKNWSLYLSFLLNISQKMIWIDRQLLNALTDSIMVFVSKQVTIDGCITILFKTFIDNKATSFVDCLYLLHIIVEKYNFLSPGKSLIFETLIQYLQSKMTSVANKQVIQVAKQLQLFSKSIPINGLFRLSQKKQFFHFYQKMKQICFNLNQSHIFWRTYNYNSIVLLCQHNKITQRNANFIKYLIQNMYLQDPDHPLASNRLFMVSIKINELRELAKSQKKYKNEMKINMKGVYSLIDHCRGWLTLYFLYDHGVLNGTSDLSIPFLANQITNQSPPGGVIPYYLSGKCELHELYLLLNIIVYRELGNKISYLTTLVPVVIYQQTVEKLIEEINKPTNEFFVQMIIILLKEVHNSLNNGYIIKTGTVCKDIQRQLGSVHQDGYRKKQVEAADALARASTRIQLALQESKTEKELTFLLQLQINVIKKIQQDQNSQVTREMLKLLVEQIKRIPQSVFQRLKMVGLRFFQVSKEHWLYNKQPSEPLEPKSQKMTEVVLYDNTNFQKLLEENYQKLLREYNEKGMQSEKNWQNLLISNTYWFQHQGDLSDLSTKFYQLDQKEIGPFGFYKLGIKPVRTDLQKLPFPRRQQYKDLIVKKEQQRKLRDIAPRQTILNSKSTFFTQASRPQSLVRSTFAESVVIQKQKKLNKEYWCQWVTKRGVYAGKLCKRDKKLEFTFTGHSKLPDELVYQMSTNKCHWIEQLSEWQLKQFGNAQIPYLGSEIFTRRYILRHTAFQIFNPNTHRSYFLNLFFQKQLQSFLSEFKNGEADLIINRPDVFNKRGFTQKWIKGQISNFEYLCLVNRYSGRTTNDLAQYPVFPWVLVNFNGQDGYTQINQKYMNQPNNMRDLTKPTGKLGEQKFRKLKSRLEQIDPADIEIRFLYGTMYSNPTLLYNFFIRLQPYTSLHWAHQSGKLDHADRLFSGVYEQFITILTSSSDMKELCPQFYYWPEFLRNRNRIELGRKQKGDEVDAVVLPVWAKNPQEFIFKMREVLESPQVTRYLHHWIDLIFGEKAPYQKAEQNDNLYHYQCYEQDIFTRYESQAEMRTAQIAISEFGQVPEQIFDKPHPSRIPRKEIYLDTVITISKSQKKSLINGYQYNEVGIMYNTPNEIIFKKTAINGFYNNFQWTRDYQFQANSLYLDSIYNSRWIALLQGSVRLYQRKKLKAQYQIQSRCLECMGDYLFFGIGSKITIMKIVNESFQEMTQLFGHHSQVILIRTQPSLDLLVSVDRSGLVLIHELVQLRFLRAFHLGTEFDTDSALKLRCCIHRMGYFIFFDHEQTLYVYNYLGEQLLEQQMLIKTQQKTQTSEKQDLNCEQIITGIQLFSHDAPIILTSTSRGNIYAFNFLQIMRFKEIYPYKNYGREIKNLLSAVTKRKTNSIIQFSIIRSLGTSNTIYQIIVLYDDGQLVCFSQNVQMTKQLSSNIRLKTMGIV